MFGFREAEAEIGDWLEHHGTECSCPYCANSGDDMEHSLRGTAYNLQRSVGELK
jgi:hypothetical protein